jgi:hypothetical protein
MKLILASLLLLSSLSAFSSTLYCEGIAMTAFYQRELEPVKEAIKVEIRNINNKSATIRFNQSGELRLNAVVGGNDERLPYKNFSVNTDKFGSYVSMSIPKSILEGENSNKRVLISQNVNDNQYGLVQSTTISLQCMY